MVISGKVITGANKAAFFTGLDWVKEQCCEKFGFIPFPGTLNIEMADFEAGLFENLEDMAWKELVPPDPNFCSSKIVPISVGKIKGALIQPEEKVNIHGKHIVEILAPVKLRDELGLVDGDFIEIKFEQIMAAPALKLSVDAVLFDLDGTLIDSIESYYRIVEITLDKMGFPAVPRSLILEAAKNPDFGWDLILPDVPGQTKQETAAGAWQITQKLYPDIFMKHVRPLPGTGKVVRFLYDNNIKMGIATSTSEKDLDGKMKILEKDGIADLVDVVVSAGDVERKKPFPDPLILCMERLGMGSDQCVYVGDMGMDVVAGRNAGMKTIGVLTGFETYSGLADNNPDAIIDSIADLPLVLDI